jgi:hypothetical protein
MQRFDASADLTVHSVSADLEPGQAVFRVRTAVESLPSAGWVFVEWCGDAPATLSWVTLYEPGRAAPQSGGPYDAIAALVGHTVRQVLHTRRDAPP